MAGISHWQPLGHYYVKAVGTAAYADALAEIAQNSATRSARVFCRATLVAEDDNPHDEHAVCVEIEGRRVAYLDRDFAPAFRAALRAKLGRMESTSADAVITGGFSADGRDYSYGIELDFNLDSDVSDSIAPTYPAPDRRDSVVRLAQREDGRFAATVWLDSHVLRDLNRRWETMAWTTEQWKVVNFYLKGSKGAGLGHKLLSVPKVEIARVFGGHMPSMKVESITGRFAVVSLGPAA